MAALPAEAMPGPSAGPQENRRRIKAEARRWGADLFGVADLRGGGWPNAELPPSIARGLPFGISLGVGLCAGVVELIEDHPTLLYLHHYRQVNQLLDQLALRVARLIEELGHRALPIPASQTLDPEGLRAHLSHRALAVAAGLGWRGRNNLLVTPRFGARVRLVSVLTDLPLRVDRPYEGPGCGECRRCVAACPAGAIGERAEDFDWRGCLEKLREFSDRYRLGEYICGICVRACGPPTRRTEASAPPSPHRAG